MEEPNIIIRRAKKCDTGDINRLLYEVHKVHSDARPDIFKAGGKKYTESELEAIISDDKRPIFVAEESGKVLGYAFCIYKRFINDNSLTDIKTLYIDDLCVDENCRGQHVGTLLFDYVKQYARDNGCYDVTLNVWEGNDNARRFYEKMGMFVKETQMEILLDK